MMPHAREASAASAAKVVGVPSGSQRSLKRGAPTEASSPTSLRVGADDAQSEGGGSTGEDIAAQLIRTARALLANSNFQKDIIGARVLESLHHCRHSTTLTKQTRTDCCSSHLKDHTYGSFCYETMINCKTADLLRALFSSALALGVS